MIVAAVHAACLTAPPPDLPSVPPHRPTILHDEVVPRADIPLVDWPADGTFLVNVQVDPGQSFTWAAFVDYDAADPPAPSIALSVPAPPGVTIVGVSFSPRILPEILMDGLCHRIDFVVAESWGLDGSLVSYSAFHSPQGSGGDIVTWWYTGGLGISDCSPYGASALPEGGFPPPDAPSDSPPPVPE